MYFLFLFLKKSLQRYYFLAEKYYLCSKITHFYIKVMVSNAVKEVTGQDRRKLLAGFLYDMAKLMFGSVAVGGLRWRTFFLDIFQNESREKVEGKLVI